jgi:signal transduction histidine kinase
VVPIWNALILMVFYFVVVWLLINLRSLHRDLEARVRERTVALRREMAERQRLEEEILKVSERERRSIGHDLHDSLCQHLTGTALAGQVLGERLVAKSLPEAADAGKVVELIEEGINLARNLARGLYPVDVEAEGLMDAFKDLAAGVTNGGKARCVFECAAPVLIHDDEAATQLYRIAQEAVRNALQHGKPKRIGLTLAERGGFVTLTVEDDGTGVPEIPQKSDGLGIRIMAHRAAILGGSFAIEPGPTGGTIVTCSVPKNSATAATAPREQDLHDT